MEQTIVGMAGSKQSGKSTSYSCIKLWRPEAKNFAFADSLKRMAVDILGLEESQAFGTDEQKNMPVPHLLWENFPLPVFEKPDGQLRVGKVVRMIGYGELNKSLGNIDLMPAYIIERPTWGKEKSGPMTGRQVLQYWGTEIFRRQYNDVWADACIRTIKKSGCQLAVITDCRFPNEVEAVQKAGGKVIRLTKVVFPDDNHPSETALDDNNFDQSKFDYILDNQEMNVTEQCEALYAILRKWGVVSHKQVGRIHI